jgi:hypothetical protein
VQPFFLFTLKGPLSEPTAKLARLLARAPTGIVFNEHTDQNHAPVFQHACRFGLAGLADLTELAEPIIAPVLSALGLPQDGSTELTVRSDNRWIRSPPNSPFGTGSSRSRGNFWRSSASRTSS